MSAETAVPAQVPIIYGVDDVAKLTGLRLPLVQRWARDGFYKPSCGSSYSFRDIVSLRVLAVLRLEHHVSRQALKQATEKLKAEAEEPWASLRIGVIGKEIVFLDRKSGRFISTKPKGQHVAEAVVKITEVKAAVRRQALKLRQRSPEQFGRFEHRRGVVAGAEVFEGTRIPVRQIARARLGGLSEERLLRMFPTLTVKDVRAAVAYEENRHQRSA